MKNGKVKGEVSRLDVILVKYQRPAAATSDGKAAGFAFSLNFDSFSKFVYTHVHVHVYLDKAVWLY